MPTIIPSAQASVDTKDGNHFEIYKVTHTTGTTTDIAVPDGCVSAAVLGDDITATVVPIQETSTSAGITVRNLTSGASGLSFGNWATGDGLKQITIHSDVVTGTYYVVARIVGSAGGTGSTKQSDL